MVSTAEGIAITELVVYIPIFFLTLFILFQHGFRLQLAWIYLLIFCIIRSVGAGFKIASEKNLRNSTDIEWSAILQSVGLSPLLLASLGLLKRVTDEVSNRVRSISRRSLLTLIAHVPIIAALALCIIGGIDLADSSSSKIKTGQRDTKIGIVIFLIVYLLLTALVVITMKDVGSAPKGEKRIYWAVLAALPLLAVRLLWSLLAAFRHDGDFSVVGGKPLIQLFMAVLEEFGVVVLYTGAGLMAGNESK